MASKKSYYQNPCQKIALLVCKVLFWTRNLFIGIFLRQSLTISGFNNGRLSKPFSKIVFFSLQSAVPDFFVGDISKKTITQMSAQRNDPKLKNLWSKHIDHITSSLMERKKTCFSTRKMVNWMFEQRTIWFGNSIWLKNLTYWYWCWHSGICCWYSCCCCSHCLCYQWFLDAPVSLFATNLRF